MPEIRSRWVLVVDRAASIRKLMSIYLEGAGFQVIQAEDGIMALAKLRDTLPRVIISELDMTRMSGFEFIEIVRRRFPTIPIIVFTSLVPNEFPPEAKPDFALEKVVHGFPDLVQVVNNLVPTKPVFPELS